MRGIRWMWERVDWSMQWGQWSLKTLFWGLIAGAGVLVVVSVLAYAALALDLPLDYMVPFNLAAYFVAGSVVAAMTAGGAKEGAQGGILVGLMDGTAGWLPPAVILAQRPDLNSVALFGPEGFAWDLFLASILISVSFAALLGMLGGWVIARLRSA